jgi:zinc transport system substrate-binding protein
MQRFSLFIIILIFAANWSCQSNRTSENITKVVTVTILPQQYVLSKIAGDKFSINVLIPEDANHETYEPTARQMVETGRSMAYFKVGHLDVEKSWLGKIGDSNPGMKIYDTSEGLDLIYGETHMHGDHVHEGGIDPHTWLSVSGIKVQADNILKGLTENDPENAAFYKNNHALFVASLDSLDREIRSILDSSGTDRFMIYHPSLGYFARDYNLTQIAIEQEGKEPSPAYMKELIDLARQKKINTIFISSQFNKQSAVTIAGQLNAKVEEFNPSSPDWGNNMVSIARKIAGTTAKK